MSEEIKIEGVDEALKVLNDYPSKINSVVRRSLRVAVKPVITSLKSQAPNSSFKKLVKYQFAKADIPTIKFGFFSKEVRNDDSKKGLEWFKVYWNNYGTMWSRWKGHTFKTSVKAKNKDRIGVRFKLFFEKATSGKETIVYSEFQKAITTEANKLKNGNS